MAAAEELRAMLSMRAECSVVFASARSQDEFLASLRTQPDIEWKRVAVVHLDEYVGLPANHPASIRYYLRDRLPRHISVKEFHELHGEAPDPAAECTRYAELLDRKEPVLIAFGIGENGHLASYRSARLRFCRSGGSPSSGTG